MSGVEQATATETNPDTAGKTSSNLRSRCHRVTEYVRCMPRMANTNTNRKNTRAMLATRCRLCITTCSSCRRGAIVLISFRTRSKRNVRKMDVDPLSPPAEVRLHTRAT